MSDYGFETDPSVVELEIEPDFEIPIPPRESPVLLYARLVESIFEEVPIQPDYNSAQPTPEVSLDLPETSVARVCLAWGFEVGDIEGISNYLEKSKGAVLGELRAQRFGSVIVPGTYRYRITENYRIIKGTVLVNETGDIFIRISKGPIHTGIELLEDPSCLDANIAAAMANPITRTRTRSVSDKVNYHVCEINGAVSPDYWENNIFPW